MYANKSSPYLFTLQQVIHCKLNTILQSTNATLSLSFCKGQRTIEAFQVFNSISAMPLFHNKFITDHDDKAVVMARYTRKILAELDDQGKELLIGDMYEEISPNTWIDFFQVLNLMILNRLNFKHN